MWSKIIFFPLHITSIFLIFLYKLFISPFLNKACIYYPTCSTYALNAIRSFGIFKGIFFATKRILRCTPKHMGGFDPVPPNIKGDFKWII